MNKKIRVGICGVGNCCSSLIQGLEFYRYKIADPKDIIPGLMHVELGGYHINDILPVAAFDVDCQKVGFYLGYSIFKGLNNTEKFSEPPESTKKVPVHKGPLLDGLGKYLSEVITVSGQPDCNVVQVLKDSGAEILINYMPVGADTASKFYADAALQAGCAFINCVPTFIASDPKWANQFIEKNLPIIGDDVKSQVGATIVHRVLANLFRERGVRLDRTYQINMGGNSDFLNMLERSRLSSKKKSKTDAVQSQLETDLPPDQIHVGPSDHIPWLKDHKICKIRMEGTTFGNMPLRLDVDMEVVDSPNSAGVVIDAIRICKIALDRKIGGPLMGPSAYLMKSPPTQYSDAVARVMSENFIQGVI
jgi:myo-inositol-1-phosphate synthase